MIFAIADARSVTGAIDCLHSLFVGSLMKRPLIREDLNVLQTSVPGG